TISRGPSPKWDNNSCRASHTTAVRAALAARTGPVIPPAVVPALSVTWIPSLVVLVPADAGGSERERRLVLHEPRQEPADEAGRVIGGELLGHTDRLGDRHPVRNTVVPQKLVGAHPQDVAVHDRHTLQSPADGVG